MRSIRCCLAILSAYATLVLLMLVAHGQDDPVSPGSPNQTEQVTSPAAGAGSVAIPSQQECESIQARSQSGQHLTDSDVDILSRCIFSGINRHPRNPPPPSTAVPVWVTPPRHLELYESYVGQGHNDGFLEPRM